MDDPRQDDREHPADTVELLGTSALDECRRIIASARGRDRSTPRITSPADALDEADPATDSERP